MKSRRYRKKNVGKTKCSGELVKCVKKVVNSIDKKNIEYKNYYGAPSASPWFIFDGASNLIGTPGTAIIALLDIPQGAGDLARVGDVLTVKRIKIRGFCYNNVNGTGAGLSNTYTNWRIIVFQYKSDDSAPTVAKLLIASAANVGNTQGTFSSIDQDHRDTYHILYDKIFTTEAGQYASTAAFAGVTGKLVHHFNFHVPLKYAHKKIRYINGTLGGTNKIYMLVTTDQASVNSNPSLLMSWQVEFIDS